MLAADHVSILEQSEVRFGYRLAVLANWYRGPGYKTIEEAHGISEPECSVLFCIGHSPDLTATDICHITGRPKNTMSRAIHFLRRKKLLVREGDPQDARRKLLRLTPEGQVLYRRTIPVFLATEQKIIGGLTPSELSDLDRLLTKMLNYTSTASEIY